MSTLQNMLVVIDNAMSATVLLEKALKMLPEKLSVLLFDESALKDVTVSLDERKNKSCSTEVIDVSTKAIKNKADKVIEIAGQYAADTIAIHRQNIADQPRDFSFEKKLLKGLQKTNLLMCGDKRWKKQMSVLATLDTENDNAQQMQLNSEVLDVSARMAGRINGELHLMSVLAISRVSDELDIVEASEVLSKKGKSAKVKLEKFANAKKTETKYLAHVVAGVPYKQIPSAAKKLKVDLVVLGNVGRTGLQGLIVGNTAEKILQRLSVDTLMVKK